MVGIRRMKGIGVEYERILSYTEVKRRFIYVAKDFRDLFPEIGESFKIWVGEKKIEAKLDWQYRI